MIKRKKCDSCIYADYYALGNAYICTKHDYYIDVIDGDGNPTKDFRWCKGKYFKELKRR